MSSITGTEHDSVSSTINPEPDVAIVMTSAAYAPFVHMPQPPPYLADVPVYTPAPTFRYTVTDACSENDGTVAEKGQVVCVWPCSESTVADTGQLRPPEYDLRREEEAPPSYYVATTSRPVFP